MNCKINKCKNKVHARGWCSKHYMRWYIHDDPLFIKQTHEMHGYSKHILYRAWDNIKTRCYNKNCKYYKYYGGRGITIYKEWVNDPKAFIEWALNNGWKQGLEIDRKDNNGNYDPSNCRFITHAENMCNTRLLWSHNTSGFNGVSYQKNIKKWEAYITVDNRKKRIGYFATPELAAKAVSDNRTKEN